MGMLRCAISSFNAKQPKRILGSHLLCGLFCVSSSVTDAVGIQINIHLKGLVMIGTAFADQTVFQLTVAVILLNELL